MAYLKSLNLKYFLGIIIFTVILSLVNHFRLDSSKQLPWIGSPAVEVKK